MGKEIWRSYSEKAVQGHKVGGYIAKCRDGNQPRVDNSMQDNTIVGIFVRCSIDQWI